MANEHGSLPLAYQFYLPHEWAEDRARRKKAGVQGSIEFRNKTAIALKQLSIPGAGILGFMRSIIEAEPFQDPRRMFLHARRAGRRLFRTGKMQQVALLPPGSERIKGFGYRRIVIQTPLELHGYGKLCRAFHFHLRAGFLDGNGLTEIAYNRRSVLFDVRTRPKPDLSCGLHVFCLLYEDTLWVFEQGPFEEQQGAVILKTMDHNYIATMQIVTGLAPFEFFIES